MASQANYTKHLRRVNTVLLKLFQKTERKENFQICLESSITLISKPDKESTKKGNHGPISLMNMDAKILNKILPNWMQQYIQQNQVGFIPGLQTGFDIHKSVNGIYHIRKRKDKGHIINSTDAEKHLTKYNIHSW